MTAKPSEDSSLLVHAYVDGELDPANALELERRMAAEPALAAERVRVEALRRALHQRLPRETLPPGLRARIEHAVGRRRPRLQPSWRALAASVALAAVISSGSTFLVLGPRPADVGIEAALAGHIRGRVGNPVEVASSDKHTVKPWFADHRIPWAPRVVTLSGEFLLVGGRIDVVDRTPVPTLVYRHREHLISLTEVQAARGADSAPVRRNVDGFNVVSWTEDGISYSAISDVAASELDAFAKLFRTAPADQ